MPEDLRTEEESTGFASAPGAPEAQLPGRLVPRTEERLQKILSHAGIASRRHAEELIASGRVQVNGQIVTALGSKADPDRDHIRVDGKLLKGAETHRTFILNKPRGYVTTVSDPEGRPTVMQFFSKLGERLYPVGRLDFQSEGLLLVTNDGDLANKLTRAASGVEKVYLVKVSGTPTEDELDQLRTGVRITKGREVGGKRVKTAPARIRLVRSGENPWYEVALIEGRNRELRKMFEEVDHHVEKIRRVAYGPLVLDLEPGNYRELSADELALLNRAADGKWRPGKLDFGALLPKEAGRAVDHEAAKERAKRPFDKNFRYQSRGQGTGGRGQFQRTRDEGRDTREPRQYRSDDRGQSRSFERKPFAKREGSREEKPFRSQDREQGTGGRGQFQRTRDEGRGTREPRPYRGDDRGQSRSFERKPFVRREGSSEEKPFRTQDREQGTGGRGQFQRTRDEGRGTREPRPYRSDDRSQSRSFDRKPFAKREGSREEKPFRNRSPRPDARQDQRQDQRPARPSGDSDRSERSGFKPRGNKPFGSKPAFKSGFKSGFKGKPSGDGNRGGQRSGPRPGSRPGGSRPFRRKDI